ncbi:MAG: arsenite methyltransferase [Bacillota bacterium]|nr:arsenite methyltransferase [Bacillota bacterium]
MNKDDIKKEVRNEYGKIPGGSGSCCSPQTSCCGNEASILSKEIGYLDEELAKIPQDANLGLGCGNPVAFASIKKGETVLDLGSGAGIDCFLAAAKVGPEGKVIGVDMTPEMVEKARENANTGNYGNVEFKLGEIENIPAADNHVDLIISNCVINLSPDKKRVFKESFRVLKPGGRLMVSDIVLTKELPSAIRDSIEAYVSCISGAMLKEEYLQAVESAGFTDLKVISEKSFPVDSWVNDSQDDPLTADSVLSISVYAKKP